MVINGDLLGFMVSQGGNLSTKMKILLIYPLYNYIIQFYNYNIIQLYYIWLNYNDLTALPHWNIGE